MALSKYDIQIDLDHRQGTSHALLVELIGSNKRVLDVGCDTGYLGEALAALGNDTSGFEVNEVTAQEARKRLVRVEVGDLENSDLVSIFGAESFDIVVFGDVLEHLRDPLPVLRQARRLLTSGGSVVISTPNVAHGDVRLALLKGRFTYTKVGILDVTHTRFFTRDSLVEFVGDAGFVVADLRRTHAPLFATEVGVREEDFDPAVVALVREDSEATTYQFVLRVVPDDATTLETAQALRLDDAQRALTAERALTASALSDRDALAARVETLLGELAQSEERVSALQHEVAAIQAERERSLARRAYRKARDTLR